MKKLLVPVDFSNHSHNAYLFARELAKALGADITLVHINSSGFTDKAFRETPVLVEELKVLSKRLAEFESRFPEEDVAIPEVKTNPEVIVAPVVVNKIVELSADFDLVVLGTIGEHPVLEKFLGSVSSGVAQKAACPVLLIPKGAHFDRFEKIVYAGNWESAGKATIDAISWWARHFDAHIDFVHISPEYELKAFEKVKEELSKSLRESEKPDFRFSLTNIQNNSPLEGIIQYADQQQADLIVLVNRQRSVFQNILGLSMTKELALHTNIPILIFHYTRD